jgi:transcriptional regulator with XRE-family HTH domain
MDGLIPFSQRLQDLLNEARPPRTQAWLAEKAGVERSTVSRLLKGERHPTFDTLKYLAPVLGISVDELVRGTDAQEKIEDASQFIHRAAYDAAVSKLAEYEGRLNDAQSKLRDAELAVSHAEALRKKENDAFVGMRGQAERLSIALDGAEQQKAQLEERNHQLKDELERYRGALYKAVGQISVLQAKLTQMAEELKATNESSRTAALFAGIAALTGVVTAASFLGGEESSRDDSSGQGKAARKRSKR